MQKTKELVNNPISEESLELIGGTGQVFKGFKDKMTQAPLKKWLQSAGITKHITFHCARHTFGSLQVEAGTNIYVVQKMLVHKNGGGESSSCNPAAIRTRAHCRYRKGTSSHRRAV